MPSFYTHDDIYQRLHEDHERVADLLDRLDQTDETDPYLRQQLFLKVRQEIEAHSKAEDRVFYARLMEHEDTRSLAIEGREEHEMVEELLEELGSIPFDSQDWTALFGELKEQIEHHVQEEEGELFDHARDILSKEEEAQYCREFEARKEHHLGR